MFCVHTSSRLLILDTPFSMACRSRVIWFSFLFPFSPGCPIAFKSFVSSFLCSSDKSAFLSVCGNFSRLLKKSATVFELPKASRKVKISVDARVCRLVFFLYLILFLVLKIYCFYLVLIILFLLQCAVSTLQKRLRPSVTQQSQFLSRNLKPKQAIFLSTSCFCSIPISIAVKRCLFEFQNLTV